MLYPSTCRSIDHPSGSDPVPTHACFQPVVLGDDIIRDAAGCKQKRETNQRAFRGSARNQQTCWKVEKEKEQFLRACEPLLLGRCCDLLIQRTSSLVPCGALLPWFVPLFPRAITTQQTNTARSKLCLSCLSGLPARIHSHPTCAFQVTEDRCSLYNTPTLCPLCPSLPPLFPPNIARRPLLQLPYDASVLRPLELTFREQDLPTLAAVTTLGLVTQCDAQIPS